MQLDGFLGLSGWRWLFILEGIPACVLGIVCYFQLTDRPDHARWLSDEQRYWLTQKLAAEREVYGTHRHGSLWQGLSDSRVLMLCLVYFAFGLAVFGVGLWTPLIIKNFGVTNANAGYLSAIPGIFGILGLLFWPRHSDKKKDRRWHLVAMGIGAGGGLLLAASQSEVPVFVMIGICITAFCSYGSFALILTWPTAAMSGTMAAAATALITALGTSSGYFGPQVIGILRDLTGGFQSAVAITACGVLMGPVLLTFFGRFVNFAEVDDAKHQTLGARRSV
jgi:ACS family tartrate transporter-like MFS transporter